MPPHIHDIIKPEPDAFNAAPFSPRIESKEILQPLFFDEGSAVLGALARERLRDYAAVLAWVEPMRVVEVRGHADGEGTWVQNQRLSRQRALAVVSELESLDVRKGLLQARGLGSSRPASSGAAAGLRAINRRVDFRVHVDPLRVRDSCSVEAATQGHGCSPGCACTMDQASGD